MSKKSGLKAQHRTAANSPVIDRLLEDYLTTEKALEIGSGTALFRGHLVTRESLAKQFFAAGEAQGIERMWLLAELIIATKYEQP